MKDQAGSSFLVRLAPVVGLSLAYLVAGRLATLLAIPPGHISGIWPASGIALAGILLFGSRMWPAIFVGSFLVGFWTAVDSVESFTITKFIILPMTTAIGASLQALIGAFLINRFIGFPTPLDRLKDLAKILILGGPVSCLVSVTIGIGALLLIGTVSWNNLLTDWLKWWLGDILGVLFVIPPVLSWCRGKQQLRKSAKLVVAVPVSLAALLTVIFYLNVRAGEWKRTQLVFARQADHLVQALKTSLGSYIDVLFGIRGLYNASTHVERTEFHRFVGHWFMRHPGIQALEWIPQVPDTQRIQYEERARRSGYSDFQFQEINQFGQIQRAVRRETYFPVYYLEPYTGNERALGFDLASNPARLQALSRARDTGNPAATGRIKLVQEKGQQVGFLVLLPIYDNLPIQPTLKERREKLQGFALGVFRIKNMIETALGDFDRKGFIYRLYDVSAPAGMRLLHSYGFTNREEIEPLIHDKYVQRTNQFLWVDSFSVGDRQWTIRLSPTVDYLKAQKHWQAWAVFTGGLLFTSLLGTFLIVITGRNAHTERMVLERTAELSETNANLKKEIAARQKVSEALRVSEETFLKLAASAQDAIITADNSGTITYWNRAAERIFGYPNSEALGKEIHGLLAPKKYAEAYQKGFRQWQDTGQGPVIGNTRELSALKKGGAEFPIELSLSSVKIKGEWSAMAFVRDISDRKRAELALAQARQRELEIGARIQETLLLGIPPGDMAKIQIGALTTGSRRIDGDFYDFFKHSDSRIDIVIGDVMGKGVPAALMGAGAKSHFLHAMTQLIFASERLPQPAEIVQHAHQRMVRELIGLESFITLCYSRLDLEQQQVHYVDCGHTKTIHFGAADHCCTLLEGPNLPLGFSAEERYQQNSAPFGPGDILFFYSDGITEAQNDQGEFFGTDRLIECIRRQPHLAPKELIDVVRQMVVEFSGSEVFADDFTCIAVKIEDRAKALPLAHDQLEIPSDLKELGTIRNFVRNFCQQAIRPALGEETTWQLELAANEAAANIMQHAYGGRDNQPIQIEADVFADHLQLCLNHWGNHFKPPATVPAPQPDELPESGFGLFLMDSYTDEVIYSRDALGKNTICLVKKLR